MNQFGINFYKILQKYKDKQLLRCETYLNDFVCYCDDFPQELLIENLRLTNEKAKYVSKKNQRGEIRTEQGVKVNVFKGIMAETVGQIYLNEVCKFDRDAVKRYDLERTTFRYDPSKEYDVGIFRNNQLWAEIGVKASKISKIDFESFLKTQHCIIGKYKYNGRVEDHDSAYYLGVVIVYDGEYDEETFVDEYLKGKIKTYIVSGATISEMTGRYSTNNIKMNQVGTTYNLGLRSYIAGDSNDSKEKIIKLYNDDLIIDYEYSRDADKRIAAYVTAMNYYHYFHLKPDCPYIKGRNDVIVHESVKNARENGGIRICPECKKRMQDGGD